MLELVIEDDGRGIPAADRSRIFEPFFTTRREIGGTGLGLPIVKSLAEAAGGTVHLDNNVRATRFVVSLPHGDDR